LRSGENPEYRRRVSGYLRDLNADAEVALQKICTQRGWRSQRLGSDLYLFEDLSETLVRVDNDLLSPLLRSDSSASLREALTHGVTAGPRRELPTGLCVRRRGYLVPLVLPGRRVEVVCTRQACADGGRLVVSGRHP